MPPSARTLALPLLAAALWATPSPAQAPPSDSIAALRAARQEQTRFETVRRRNLTTTRSWGGGVDCDERIGRFCLTRGDDDDEDWVAPPERPVVAAARTRLIAYLDTAAAVIPGDWWVAGQRVRYLVEARRFADARAAGGACRGERWWCAALAGIAAHFAGAATAADSAFSAMVPDMPDDVRKNWMDLTPILEPELYRQYRRLEGAARDSFVQRYWGLADPFYSRPGNEVRAEHFARNLLDDLQDRAESPDNLRWGSDLREILLRFGWPTGWERAERDRPYVAMESSYISHYADTNLHILPPPEIFLDSGGVAAGEWDVEKPDARASYAIPVGDSLVRWLPPIEHQVALFHRGDSALVVAAYTVPDDTIIPAGARWDVTLSSTPDGARVDTVVTGSAGTALRLHAPARPMVASLELLIDSAHIAARARRGLDAAPLVPGRLAVSDLLLLREGPEPPTTLDEAMGRARGSIRVRAGEGVGVFWEVYGLDALPTGELTMALRIVAEERGWLRRAAERARIVRAAEPVQLIWREPMSAGAIVGRSLGIQVPPVPPGEYAIELSVTMAGGEPLVARQRIEVEDEETRERER